MSTKKKKFDIILTGYFCVEGIRMDSEKKKILNDLLFIFIISFIYGFFCIIGVGCPIKFLTGISCGGCGMTRAWISVLKFDFLSAFEYHPLFWTIPFIISCFLLRKKINRYLLKTLTVLTIILFIGVYLYRMFCGVNDIVVFRPQDGFAVKILNLILGGFWG